MVSDRKYLVYNITMMVRHRDMSLFQLPNFNKLIQVQKTKRNVE